MPSELEQLKTGMALLEAQRSTLGDEVVDLALAPLRAKLAALDQVAPIGASNRPDDPGWIRRARVSACPACGTAPPAPAPRGHSTRSPHDRVSRASPANACDERRYADVTAREIDSLGNTIAARAVRAGFGSRLSRFQR